tara:strand:- start:197 stop:400 length:204 start_codon:yes stop_codon:yes gene_type:complete
MRNIKIELDTIAAEKELKRLNAKLGKNENYPTVKVQIEYGNKVERTLTRLGEWLERLFDKVITKINN